MARDGASWGRLPASPPASVRQLRWRDEPLPVAPGETVLAHGLGRSYGDSCLNSGGVLLDTTRLDHVIEFDEQTGVLECEAGMTIAAILDLLVPQGWFLAVTPGTKFVTVGGAIANDVHGKNHHRAGTFGRHIESLALRRSDGSLLVCSRDSNAELFAATIGGLGLTGLIVSARLRLRPIHSQLMLAERIAFSGLDEFFALSDESDAAFEYTVAWIDAAAPRGRRTPGVFARGNHAEHVAPDGVRRPRQLVLPVDLPGFALNRWSVAAFYKLYRRLQTRGRGPAPEHYEPFFYPLDSIAGWNRLYGRRGLYQYQCVVPPNRREALDELLRQVRASSEVPFLSVLKVFGELPSPGRLSFPRPGTTLALDFPNRGRGTLELFDRLDVVVLEAGGAVYPAKDARMSGETFRRSFPGWHELSALIDPAFSSSFWRRING